MRRDRGPAACTQAYAIAGRPPAATPEFRMTIRSRRRALLAAAAGTALAAATAPARAQGTSPAPTDAGGPWPNRPIRLIVPYAPGGATDQLARALGERLSPALGQPVVIENRPGGNTIVGASAAAKAAPDGYTLFMGSSASLALNRLLYEKLPYDPRRDLVGVSMLARTALVMVVHPSVAAKSVAEFVALARAQPSAYAYASVGNGNPLHLAGELLDAQAGIQTTHVPFNGSAPALTALLGGHVQLMYDAILTATPHIRAGRLRALAVTGATRAPSLPELPTIAESGYPGYEAGIWFALVAPRGTPEAIVQRLNTETVKALRQPEMKNRFESQALELVPGAPEDVQRLADQEVARWGRVIRDRNIRLEL
jgi:tripartite-type tricarboxylate transporter receptor subunit TctC